MTKVICPYCGYRLPLFISPNTSAKNLTIYCKGRNCKKSFELIIKDGIQRNIMPDNETIEAFKTVYGKDYKKHILQCFGVTI